MKKSAKNEPRNVFSTRSRQLKRFCVSVNRVEIQKKENHKNQRQSDYND